MGSRRHHVPHRGDQLRASRERQEQPTRGLLHQLDAAGEAAVNSTNAKYSVRWIYSYANPAKTRTYCLYEAPSQQAVRDAAKANKLPVDEIVEIPHVIGAH